MKAERNNNALATSFEPESTGEGYGGDQYPKGIKLAIIMTSLMLGTSLMALDAMIISVATPKITTEFQALNDVGWYGAAYSMLLTAATPIASNFYKYFNPKYVYLAFILVFEGVSVRLNQDIFCLFFRSRSLETH